MQLVPDPLMIDEGYRRTDSPIFQRILHLLTAVGELGPKRCVAWLLLLVRFYFFPPKGSKKYKLTGEGTKFIINGTRREHLNKVLEILLPFFPRLLYDLLKANLSRITQFDLTADSYPVAIYVFCGVNRLDTRMD